MRTLISALAIAFMGLTGCDSDDKSDLGGLGTSTGTGTGTGLGTGTLTGTGTGTGTITGTGTGTGTNTGTGIPDGCNAPSCLTTLYGDCAAPSGTCVEQSDAATMSSNICFSNGAKMITSMDATGMVTTFKNGSKVCFSMVADLTSMIGLIGGEGTMTIALKNGAGATVGTISSDANGQTTMTCAGGSPVVLNAACNDSSVMPPTGGTPSGDTECTPGVCTP